MTDLTPGEVAELDQNAAMLAEALAVAERAARVVLTEAHEGPSQNMAILAGVLLIESAGSPRILAGILATALLRDAARDAGG